MYGSIHQNSNERGAALVVALMVLVVLVTVSAALVTTSIVNSRLSGMDQQRAKALDIAEAGVAEAVSRIKSGEVPSDNNPRMVTKIFLVSGGSVPVLGADSTGLATVQPGGNWLNYSTTTRTANTLTVQYKTDAARSSIFKFDVNKSFPINTVSGMPIYQVTSTGVVGQTARKLVVDVVSQPFNLNIKGALASNKNVKFTGNAFACGYNHRVETPFNTGVSGRAGVGGCNEDPGQQHWEIGSGDLTGIWSGGNVNSGGASSRDGNPAELNNQVGFYTGPWDALGLSQAQFFALTGPAQGAVPGNLNANTYLDNDGTTQNISGDFHVTGTGSGLLYVDGDLTMNAGFTWRGLIYVEGDVKLNGNAWILGSAIVKGKTETKFNGGATILYSYDAISQYISKYGGSIANLAWREVP
jgi:Tfp pilus assembly protein PilX